MAPSLIASAAERLLPGALDLLQRMVEINSYTRNPAGVRALARLTADAFSALQFQSRFVPSTNPHFGDHLLLSRPGPPDVPALLLVSHLDTVFPPEEEERNRFAWRVDGDRIFGPGTCDIKGGTASIWLLLHVLQQVNPALLDAVPWCVALNAAEEDLAPDFTDILRSECASARAALVFEAGGVDATQSRVVTRRKGRFTFELHATGRAAHAGGLHHQGANAIAALAHAILAVESFTDPPSDLTFNIGTCHGGTVVNRVPHQAAARGECRAFDPATLDSAAQRLRALAGPSAVRSRADGQHAGIAVHIDHRAPAFPDNAPTRQLAAAWKSAGDALDLTTLLEARGGLSDANYLWDVIPTLDGLGPRGGNPHCSEFNPSENKEPEFVLRSSFVPTVVLHALALHRLTPSPH